MLKKWNIILFVYAKLFVYVQLGQSPWQLSNVQTCILWLLCCVVAVAAAGGVIQVVNHNTSVTVHPTMVQLYSQPVSSRLSSDPLCLHFRYYVHSGVDGHLTVSTLDNADRSTRQWTLRGHVMRSWQFAFVQLSTATGPFQVPAVTAYKLDLQILATS